MSRNKILIIAVIALVLLTSLLAGVLLTMNNGSIGNTVNQPNNNIQPSPLTEKEKTDKELVYSPIVKASLEKMKEGDYKQNSIVIKFTGNGKQVFDGSRYGKDVTFDRALGNNMYLYRLKAYTDYKQFMQDIHNLSYVVFAEPNIIMNLAGSNATTRMYFSDKYSFYFDFPAGYGNVNNVPGPTGIMPVALSIGTPSSAKVPANGITFYIDTLQGKTYEQFIENERKILADRIRSRYGTARANAVQFSPYTSPFDGQKSYKLNGYFLDEYNRVYVHLPHINSIMVIGYIGADASVHLPEVLRSLKTYTVTSQQLSDKMLREQWLLQPGTNISIRAQEAWSLESSNEVTIAIIDTGLKTDHLDLPNLVWRNTNEKQNNQDDDNNGYVDDLNGFDFIIRSENIFDKHGHGTWLAGVIAAPRNNEKGIAGLCARCKIMPLVVQQESSKDNILSSDTATVVEAIHYAVNHKVNVILVNYGTIFNSAAIRESISYATEKNIPVVAAAGNNNNKNEVYPAAYKDVISVAGLTQTGTKDSLSSFGEWVTISAPSENIITTHINNSEPYLRTNIGSSMAAAHVTAGVAMLKAKTPDLTVSEIKTRISTKGVTPFATATKELGTGYLNLQKLLENN
jgi:subtilisin family serine protease